MSVPSGTYQTFTAIGQREDLTDVIYNISPTETPILSSLARTKATAVYHEWQTDTLAAATTNNAQVEGDDATAATISPTTRLGNYTQIVAKTIQVSGTMMAVDLAGRRAEKAYQLSKASQELKRDQETIISANQGRSAGNSSTARKMGSLLSWLKTNSNYNTTDGANPTTIGVSTRSDGTTRTFTEAILKDGVQQVYTSGGSPKILTGKLKDWMGRSHFKTRKLQNVATEASLHILAYNIKLGNFPNLRLVESYKPVVIGSVGRALWRVEGRIADPLLASGEASSFYIPVEADKTAAGTVYAGLQHVFRTTDNGKTYTVNKTLVASGLKDLSDAGALEIGSVVNRANSFTSIKGYSTPKGLYRTLYENKDSVVVFDDCDSILKDPVALNLLKSALDSYGKRIISWNAEAGFGRDDELPRSFEFKGRVIFISNLSQDKIDQAIRSRSMMVDLSMTEDQKIERMEVISSSDEFLPEFSAEQKKDALDLIRSLKEDAKEISLRTLISVTKIRASGNKNWKGMATYILCN